VIMKNKIIRQHVATLIQKVVTTHDVETRRTQHSANRTVNATRSGAGFSREVLFLGLFFKSPDRGDGGQVGETFFVNAFGDNSKCTNIYIFFCNGHPCDRGPQI